MKKAAILLLTMLVVLWAMPVCGAQAAAEEFTPYTVTDMSGTEIEITKPIERIVTIWSEVHVMAMMIGAEDKIVSVTSGAQKPGSWHALLCPELLTLTPCIGPDGQVNAEQLLALEPDIVIYSDTKMRDQMQTLGVPAAFVAVYSFADIKGVITLLGEITGCGEAAAAYCRNFDDTLAMVNERVKDIPEEERCRVYHLWGTALRSNGDKTITNEFIEVAGGVNTMKPHIDTTTKEISLELLLRENPGVILIGNYTRELLDDDIAANPAWELIDAIKNDRTYKTPAGVTRWDRYSVESPLMVAWTASVLYPEIFADFDMTQFLKDYYQQFFGYTLSDEQAEKILSAQLPE